MKIITVQNKQENKQSNINIRIETINNEYRYIVQCFKGGQQVDEQLLDDVEDAIRLCLEFCQV